MVRSMIRGKNWFITTRISTDRESSGRARSGVEKDSDLIRYYGKRTVWLLEEDGAVKLKRYLASTESTTPTHLGRVLR